VIVVGSRHALESDPDGRPSAIIELNSGITERKRAEQDLARTTTLLERTQEISKTGGWEYDIDTGELTWTDETYRIYGLEADAKARRCAAGDSGLRPRKRRR
jgi:PAS domain-containing protein